MLQLFCDPELNKWSKKKFDEFGKLKNKAYKDGLGTEKSLPSLFSSKRLL